MAQEEIIFKVGVDTGDSKTKVDNVGNAFDDVNKKVELTGRSFKELQDELKKVTQELQNLNPTSKEFENLTKKANELKREMKAVGDSMNETNNDTNKSFTSLRKELKDLTIQLQNLDPASKEFEKVAQRAGQIKEQMRGVADAINDADPEVFGGKFMRTAEGVVGGMSAITGAQALFGNSSEELEKQMLKVQGAIALTQGISAMKELRNDATDLAKDLKTKLVTAFQSLNATQISNAKDLGTMTTLQKAYNVVVGSSTGVLKNLRIALAATGIGALILAVGYLIANFDKLKGSMSQSLTNAKNFEQSTTRQAEAARYASDNFAEYERTLKRLGYTEDEISNKRKARFKDAIDKTEKEIGASRKVYDEQLKNLKIVEVFDKIGFNATGRLLFGDEETAKAQQQKVKDLNATLTKLKNDQFDYNAQIKADRQKDIEDQKAKSKQANEEALAKRKENNAKRKQEQEKEAQERLNLQRKLEDLTVANIDDVNTREIMSLKLKHDREREELIKQYEGKKGLKEKYDALMLELDTQQENERVALKKQQDDAQTEKDKAKKEKENLDKRSQLEAELISAEQDFNLKQEKRIELENLDYEQKKANTELTNGEQLLLKAQHEANLNAIAKDSTDRQKMLDEELANSKKFLVDETANMFGALAGLSEQGSAVQKAFAITQLSIDTAKAISSTIAGASAAAAAGGPAAPFLLAGYVASGIATVTKAMSSAKQILNAPMPSVQPPQMNRPTNQTQNNATQGTQTQVNAQSTYKVVVVDSDITKMQEKTKKTELISTI